MLLTRTLDGKADKPFPEFDFNDFKSSCLNDSKTESAKQKVSNDTLMPSSISMPSIAAAKPQYPVKYDQF